MRLGLFLPTHHRDYNRVSASIWIRCLQMVQYYKDTGVEVLINNPFRKYDACIYFRGVRCIDYYIMRYLRRLSKRVLWDTVVDYYVEHFACSAEQRRVAERISSLVDGIIVSTKQLAINASKFNNDVFYMPDPIDVKYFGCYKRRINYDNPIFGWSGISVKTRELNEYSDILSGRTVVISDHNKNIEFKHAFYKWDYNNFPELIARCDIGFFPRNVDGPYNLAHSSFKILAFAIQGIPIIANRVPSYVELSKYYEPICFLEDVESVADAIEILKRKPRSIDALVDHYSCDTWAINTLSFLRSLIE